MRAARRSAIVRFQTKKTGGSMIHVVAIITAKPGQRATVLEHFQANVPAVHAEAGCIEYGAAVDVEKMGTAAYGPDSFVVIEKWESEDHLKAHAAAPHMKASGAMTRDMLASRTIHVLKPVLSIDAPGTAVNRAVTLQF